MHYEDNKHNSEVHDMDKFFFTICISLKSLQTNGNFVYCLVRCSVISNILQTVGIYRIQTLV